MHINVNCKHYKKCNICLIRKKILGIFNRGCLTYETGSCRMQEKYPRPKFNPKGFIQKKGK